jgi:hypothetical protein
MWTKKLSYFSEKIKGRRLTDTPGPFKTSDYREEHGQNFWKAKYKSCKVNRSLAELN